VNREFWRSLPATIAQIVGDQPAQAITAGESGAQVWHFPGLNAYLKISDHQIAFPVQREIERLHWLTGRVPVAPIIAAASDHQRAYLLTGAISGVHPLDETLNWSPAERIQFVADAARQFHALDVTGCPWQRSIDDLLAQAEEHIARGWVREDLFEEQYQGQDPRQLFKQLLALRPDDLPPVVTHGDLFGMNIYADPEAHILSGFLDVGECASGDPYIDLAVLAMEIQEFPGTAWIEPFFAAYGIAHIDEQRLAFFQLLNEFF
jgi:aminoglycoside phosphotransferase